MSEKTNILYLCVCMALSDHKLDKTETAKIIEISKRLKVEFNVHEAAEEISKKSKEKWQLSNMIQTEQHILC